MKGRYGERAADAVRLTAAGCVPLGATSVPAPGAGTPWQTWGLGAGGRTVNPWRADRVPGGSSAGAAAAVSAGLVPLATGADGAGSCASRPPGAECSASSRRTDACRIPTGRGSARPVRSPGGQRTCGRTGGAWPGTTGMHLMRRAVTATRQWRRWQRCWRRRPGVCATPPHRRLVRLPRFRPHRSRARPRRARRRAAAPGRRGRTAAAAGRHPRTPRRPWAGLAGAAGAGRGRGAARDTAAAYRLRAVNDRRLAELFSRADLLLTPTTPNPPHGHEGPGDRYSTALTWAFNLSGHPAASIPAGFGPDGCPVGLQVVARHGEEEILLRVMAEAEEQAGLRAPRAR